MKHRSSVQSHARHMAQAVTAVALFACAASSFAAPDWDIVGIKLGMTEAEVRAAFQAYDPAGKVTARNTAFQYSDKINTFSTPGFLNRLELETMQTSGAIVLPKTSMRIWFSGPSEEARVIAVMRGEFNIPNPPTGDQFLQSLAGKYGQPSATDRTRTPVWEEQDKPSCIWATSSTNSPKEVSHTLFSLNLLQRNTFSESVSELENRQQGTGGLKGVDLPVDLANCGAFLYYLGTTSNPANSFTGAMFDVGAIVATENARNAWVEQLEAEAVRKRESQGQTPRL